MDKKGAISTIAAVVLAILIVLVAYQILGKPLQKTGIAAVNSLKTPDDMLTEARDAVAEGKCRSAIKIFSDFIVLYEDSQQAPEAWYSIGKCYAGSKDNEKAKFAFNQVARYNTKMYERNEYLELAKTELGKLSTSAS